MQVPCFGGRSIAFGRMTAIFIVMMFLPAVEADSPARPNIVFVLADDFGYGDAKCYNPDGKVLTPNIDRLAREGVRFTDAHSGSAVCSPTRYGLLTGRYAWRSTLRRGVLMPYQPPLIPAERLTVPGFLKRHGYHTACVGKWHLGWDWPKAGGEVAFDQPIKSGPTARGFDYYFGPDVPNFPPYGFIENDRLLVQPTARKEKGDLNGRPGPMTPGWKFDAILPTLVEKATGYVDERAKDGKPFFLYFPLTSPHEPVAPSARFRGKSGISAVADFIMESDWALGEVLAALDRHNLSGNTLVIFTCDNGHGWYTGLEPFVKAGHQVSGPLRGYKADVWEGGHRVPFVARWPGVAKPGTVSDEPICHTNLMATCAAILGTELPATAGEDSFSILPLLRDDQRERPTHEAVIHQAGNGTLAIRQGKWKLVFGESADQDQLFNLETDLGETRSVLAEHLEVGKRLEELAVRYIAEGRSTPGAKQANDVKVPLRVPLPKPKAK